VYSGVTDGLDRAVLVLADDGNRNKIPRFAHDSKIFVRDTGHLLQDAV
jgi:hypothetical protein